MRKSCEQMGEEFAAIVNRFGRQREPSQFVQTNGGIMRNGGCTGIEVKAGEIGEEGERVKDVPSNILHQGDFGEFGSNQEERVEQNIGGAVVEE